MDNAILYVHANMELLKQHFPYHSNGKSRTVSEHFKKIVDRLVSRKFNPIKYGELLKLTTSKPTLDPLNLKNKMFYTKTSLKIRVSIENFELWDLIILNYPLITL